MTRTLSATALAPSSLPDTIPVFPLSSAMLLPRAKLPLNIFEPRYLAMIEDALASPSRVIGMIQPQEQEDYGKFMPPLYRVGCAGRIVSFNETDDGRYLIGLMGLSRFTIIEELPFERPYRRVRPDWSTYTKDLEAPEELVIDRKHLMSSLHQYFKRHNIDADWDVIQKTPDELLVSLLVMICPLAANERQALLEAPDLSDRATMLVALLEMASLPQATEGEGGAKH